MPLKIFVLFLLLVGTELKAQNFSTGIKKAIKRFEKAYQSFQLQNNREALSQLDLAIKIDDHFYEAYLLKAEIYHSENRFEEEIASYQKVIDLAPKDYDRKVFYYIGETELRIGHYEAARDHIEHFLEDSKQKSSSLYAKAEKKLEQASFGIKALAHPVPFHPINMGEKVNSKYADYFPSFTMDERLLIKTVCIGERFGVIGGCQEDFFVCQRDDSGHWTQARNLGAPVNTPNNEGAQCISHDGRHLFFAACGGREGCDIFHCQLENGRWSVPKAIGAPVNTPAWETQPSFASDGRTLYFSSNRPGGKGKADLWMTELKPNNRWTVPVNLGDQINTPGMEHFPFIHPDNQTLYFASDGHLGLGKMDLFVSKRGEDGNWQTPVNLGFPINTYEEESSLIVNRLGNKAYFASRRDGGFGELDLYEFELHAAARPTPVTYIKGMVFDAITKQHLFAHFQLINLETDKLWLELNSNPKNGEFLLPLPLNGQYALNVSKDGYLFYSENYSFSHTVLQSNGQSAFLIQVPLEKIQIGKKVILKNVFFETASYVLKISSEVELDKLVQFLEQNPRLEIQIGGHTDNEGTEEYNLELSENRAKEVCQYLIKQGIDGERLSFKGYGYAEPIATNDTKEGRALNRRTEFMIVK